MTQPGSASYGARLPGRDAGIRTGPAPRGKPAIRFFVLLACLSLTFALLSSSRAATRYVHQPLCEFIAWLTAGLVSPLGPVDRTGPIVQFGEFKLRVVEACDGVLPISIYAAAVLAFPSRWRAKALGLLIGVPTILLVNQIRMVSLVILGAWRPELFEGVHIYVWQPLIIACSMALWIYWIEAFARRQPGDDR